MLRRLIMKFPHWTCTAVVALAICYLTLVPRPVPEDMPELFAGADKVVHALMFGALAGAIVIDYSRKKLWVAKWRVVAWAAIIAITMGGLIELLQGAMGLGRSSETADFVADAAGSILGAIIGRSFSRWLLRQQ